MMCLWWNVLDSKIVWIYFFHDFSEVVIYFLQVTFVPLLFTFPTVGVINLNSNSRISFLFTSHSFDLILCSFVFFNPLSTDTSNWLGMIFYSTEYLVQD